MRKCFRKIGNMSFIGYKKEISFQDRVIIYLRHDELQPILVTKDLVHQTKYGAIKHNDIVGKAFGSKLKISKGFVHILHPTPELWTLALRHRTQILYSVDISTILYRLDIRPGSIVVEAGTGSGSLSHAILRSIYPSGHLHTFDFHNARVDEARAEFLAHGFTSQLVTIKQRDVCGEGFGLDEKIADALFLDLPSPWLAVSHAALVLSDGGRICCFSPCIEQVQRTYDALRENGFSDLISVECVNRELIIREINLHVPDLGYNNKKSHSATHNNIVSIKQTSDGSDTINNTVTKITPLADTSIDDISSLKPEIPSELNDFAANVSKVVNNENQVECLISSDISNAASNDQCMIESASSNNNNISNNAKSSDSKTNVELFKKGNHFYCSNCLEQNNSPSLKRPAEIGDSNVEYESESNLKKVKLSNEVVFDSKNKHNNTECSFMTCIPNLKQTGHTGYLTFGTLYPK